MNCELCGRKEDERAMQEQCGLSLCLSCDGKYTDEELKEGANVLIQYHRIASKCKGEDRMN